MSKVQMIESELRTLSREELRTVRDWLDDVLQDQAAFAELKDAVAAGVEQVRSGKITSFDEAAADRIKAKGRKLSADSN